MSYTDTPEITIPTCPVCAGKGTLNAKGCHERRFRITCQQCDRETGWHFTPEGAVHQWRPLK